MGKPLYRRFGVSTKVSLLWMTGGETTVWAQFYVESTEMADLTWNRGCGRSVLRRIDQFGRFDVEPRN